MQGGGGGSLAVVDAAADDGGAADETGDPVASACSVDDAGPAVDAAGAGDGEEEGGDVAGGGVPPAHAPTSKALAIDGPRRHGSVQAQDDHERIRRSLVENSASASGAGCAPHSTARRPVRGAQRRPRPRVPGASDLRRAACARAGREDVARAGASRLRSSRARSLSPGRAVGRLPCARACLRASRRRGGSPRAVARAP